MSWTGHRARRFLLTCSPKLWAFPLAAALLLLSAPSALAGITSPTNGGVYSFPDGAVYISIPLTWSYANPSGCKSSQHVTYYQTEPGGTEAITSGGGLDKNDGRLDIASSKLGTYTARTAYTCINEGPTPSTGDDFVDQGPLESITFTVCQPSACPAPNDRLKELEQQIRAACETQRDALGQLARINQQRRDLVPIVEYMIRFTERTGWVANKGSKAIKGEIKKFSIPHAKLGPWARVAEVLEWEAKALKAEEITAKLVLRQLKEQIKRTDALLAVDFPKYNKDCKGYTVAAAQARLPSVRGQVARAAATRSTVATKAAGTRRVLVRLRRNTAAERKASARLEAALSALTSHLTRDGAPPADVAAVRTQAQAAAKLIDQHQRLQKALARDRAVKGFRLRARYVPRALRRDTYIRKLINKPLSALIANKTLLKAERQLAAALRAQPLVP